MNQENSVIGHGSFDVLSSARHNRLVPLLDLAGTTRHYLSKHIGKFILRDMKNAGGMKLLKIRRWHANYKVSKLLLVGEAEHFAF